MGIKLFNQRILTMVVLFAVALIVAAVLTSLTRLKHNESKPSEAYGFVKLPSPDVIGRMSVEEAIQRRRSIRSYADKPLSLQDVSQLMWAAQGITDPARGFRAAPSAGATYPLEVYLVVGENGVTGLDEGLYRYDPYEHQLESILKGDLRSSLAEAALDQGWVREAPVNIVIAAVYERTTGRYGERGIRYVHMEVGHVGQNLYLQATARGLGMVVIGAFKDDQVQSLLKLPYEQKPLYIIPVGYPRS
ncbi:MAG: SagB/ThcOx family dehydrogenase [Crenarchaeota archaeon]|nr:SagB/ThcOx family dehydrogenase [Thermoproteota archaeon]